MENIIKPVMMTLLQNKMFQLLIIMIIMDIIFGTMRAIRERKFNSCVGIDGCLRKTGMLISLVCLVFIDNIVDINLIGFIDETVRTILPSPKVGVTEFFAIVYGVYEVVSVLKNMSLAGLPVQTVWGKIQDWLADHTAEISDVSKR